MIHDPLSLVLAALIVAGAAAVKGAVGFGFPLIAVPLLSTILGPRIAVPVVAIPTLLSNVFLVSRGGFSRATASLAMVVAGITLGTPAGAMLIKILEPRVLSVLVGAGALLYVLATAFRLTVLIPPAAGMSVAPAVGILAGVMGGVTGISSPLLASYLHLLRVDKREFVFWITIMFFIGNVVQVARLHLARPVCRTRAQRVASRVSSDGCWNTARNRAAGSPSSGDIQPGRSRDRVSGLAQPAGAGPRVVV